MRAIFSNAFRHVLAPRVRASTLTLTACLFVLSASGPAGQDSPGVASAEAARPDANVPAGALALPDRSFLRNEPSGCDFYVDPAGNNANPGTKAAPWKTVGHATATLSAGKVACVNSGTYDETGASAADSGTQAAPIVLKRTPGSPTRPVIRLNRASSVLRIDRGYWIVDGLDFDLNRQRKTGSGMVFGSSGHHIALRNSYVHDDAGAAAVYVSADDVSIEGSEIANNFHHLGEDSHGITVFGQAARVLVRGNRIHNNGGDGLQCADETDEGTPSDGQLPMDLTIEDNRLWTSPENQGRTEQGVDIKTCQQVSIRGSVRPDANDPNAANQKFYGFKSSSDRGSGAVVIHLGARNVLVANNRIWDSCHGVGIGRHDTALGVPENVVVRRNAMFDLKAIGGACKGYGIGIQRVKNADVIHNTLDRLAGSGFRFKHGTGTAGRSPNVDFFNNIVRDASSFLDIATGEIDGFGSDHNLFYWSRDGNQSRFRIDGVAQSLDSWQHRQNGTSVLLADGNSRIADPLFVPGAGTTDDYYTQAASPARDRALDNTGAARFGAGPDLGFRETYDSPDPGGRCDTATAGAPWPGEAFGPQSGKFTATLDATPLGAPIAAGVGLSQGTAKDWTGMAAIVLFDDVSGNIKARDGGVYTAATPIPYQPNARYRVRFVVDVAARRYSAYVTPPGGDEIAIGTNLAFRTEQQAVTSLDTRTVAAGIGSLEACDLKISGGSAPEATTIFALGDGASGHKSSHALADYIKGQNPDRFFYLGDVYESGTAHEFSKNYDSAYGALAAKTDPVIGNHESEKRDSGYYPYWKQKRGWSSEQAKHRSYVTPEGWQVIAYSSEEDDAAAEGRWVSNEVAKHAGTCRIVMAHKGRHVVTDSAHGDNPEQEPIWSKIAGKTAINLVAHNHIYGRLSPVEGVNVFVSGAGKDGLRPFGTQHHAVADKENGVPTATKLVLRRGAADFQQVDKDGKPYDSGTVTCDPM